MNEHEFWFRVWLVITFIAMTVVAGLVTYGVTTNRTVERMSIAGVDPIIAACSMGSIEKVECAVAITQGRR